VSQDPCDTVYERDVLPVRRGRRAQREAGCLPLEVGMLYASVDTALYFVGTLVIAIAFIAIMVLFADCAWCAWRDRWQAKHHH
jgi:hypothetical protein